jgi:hypothetical protein
VKVRETRRIIFRTMRVTSALRLEASGTNVAVAALEGLRAYDHALTGTLAVRSSLPQLTQAPLIARRIAFQMQ